MNIQAMKQALEDIEAVCEVLAADAPQEVLAQLWSTHTALKQAISEAEKCEPDYRAIADAVVGNLEARSQVINLDLEEELVEEIMQEMADTIRDGFTTPQPAIPAGFVEAFDCGKQSVQVMFDTPDAAAKFKAMLAAAPKPEGKP